LVRERLPGTEDDDDDDETDMELSMELSRLLLESMRLSDVTRGS
jgi:hypothetical protein